MNLEKIHELNELSEDVEHNLPRMKQLAHEIIEALSELDSEKTETKWYEYSHLRICKHWIQRESCHDCTFENSCKLDKSYLNTNNK